MVKPLFAKECYKCPGALLLFSCLSKSNRGEGGSSWNAEDDRNAPSRPRRDRPPHLPSGAQLACLGTGKKERKAKKKKSWGKRQLARSRVAQAPDVQTSTYLAELSSDVDIFFDGFED